METATLTLMLVGRQQTVLMHSSTKQHSGLTKMAMDMEIIPQV